MNKKALIEKRNGLFAKLDAIVDAAKAENRAVTADEKTEFDNLRREITDIDNTIEMIEMTENYTRIESPVDGVELPTEEKEVKAFENAIRGIQNADAPTMPSDARVLIPTTVMKKILDKVIDICPIYEMAEKYNIGGKLVLPKYDRENSSVVMTYCNEGTTAESGKAVFGQIELNGYLARCLAKVSKSLINNSAFDIVNFVIDKVAEAIALFLEGELLNGTASKVEGLSGVPADMIVTAAAQTALTTDELIDVQDKVIDAYQNNAVWIMNRQTRNAIRKLKDNDDNYILNRDFTAKWGYTLLGKDVYTTDAVAAMAEGKEVIIYGDMSGLAVKISENANMQILNERYAEEHMTGILAFVELDAKVQDEQKISKLKMAAASA